MLFIWTLICFYKPFLFIFYFSVFIFFCIRIYAHATRFKWFCFFLLDPTGSASTEEISLWWQRTGTYWCLSYKLTHLSNHYYFLLKQLYLKCDVMNLHYFFHTWQLYFQDFMEDVNIAFQYLLKLTPLLDKADQRCKYVLQNVATTIFSDCNLFVF